jgi:hypothetical protein
MLKYMLYNHLGNYTYYQDGSRYAIKSNIERAVKPIQISVLVGAKLVFLAKFGVFNCSDD